MNISERIARIMRIHDDCISVATKLAQQHGAYEKEGLVDAEATERALKRLEQLEVAALRHTHILHHEASQLVVAPKIGGGDKDDEYP